MTPAQRLVHYHVKAHPDGLTDSQGIDATRLDPNIYLGARYTLAQEGHVVMTKGMRQVRPQSYEIVWKAETPIIAG